MNLKTVYPVILLMTLAGCVTPQTYPNKRPLNDQNIQAIGKTTIVVSESQSGIEKSWFMTDSSAAGAQYGLLGGLVSGIMDAIMNAGPAKRAQKAADEMAALLPAEALDAGLVEHLQSQMSAAGQPGGVSIEKVTTSNKILEPDPIDDVVEVMSTYTLSEDGSALRVITRATYQTPKIKYATPYTFKGTPPKSELSGAIYSNVFTYESPHLPIPASSPELEDRLVASIQSGYATESGAPPTADSTEGKAMAKEIAAAKDGKLAKDEIAIFLVREWLKDKGALLKREVDGAQAFVSKYILQDLNDTKVPSFDGRDETVETMTDGRTVRRIGLTVTAGSYVSQPGNLAAFTTYGNTTSMSKAQVEKVKALRDQKAKKLNGTKQAAKK